MLKIRNIGYACKTIGVRNAEMRSCSLAAATQDRLLEIARHNIAALGVMVEYNARVGIDLLRISSDVIPLASHPQINFDWCELCAERLMEVGRRVRETGLRVSMHPGQYTVLNSPNEEVARRAADDLAYHAAFLDGLGVDTRSKIVLHIGGVYGARRAARARFVSRCQALPAHILDRLVLENDEKCFAVDEVCALGRELGLPVVMDVFHHALLPPPGGSTEEWLEECGKTWGERDGRQKIHYSEQLAGGRPGSHSRTIDAARFLDFYAALGQSPPDIMLEVKDKNLSAVKCLHCLNDAARPALTAAWAEYKYAVLERSPRHYQLIREHLKAARPDPVAFYALIDAGLAREATPGTRVNAAEHVWGYFKDRATAAEKKRFEAELEKLSRGGSAAAIKRRLSALADQHGEEYLQNSLYFAW